MSDFLCPRLALAASVLTELDLSPWLGCAMDPILTLEDNVCVCVRQCSVCDRERAYIWQILHSQTQ